MVSTVDGLDLTIWDIAGLGLLVLSTYMIVTRVALPRFASPRVNRKRREDAVRRAETLIEMSEVDPDDRDRLRRCLNTLRAHNLPREAWSNQIPVADVVEEVEALWDKYHNDEP